MIVTDASALIEVLLQIRQPNWWNLTYSNLAGRFVPIELV